MSIHLVINYAFERGRGRKVQRKWGERGLERIEKKVGLCQISFLDLEGLPQMMTDSSKVFRGPVIYE